MASLKVTLNLPVLPTLNVVCVPTRAMLVTSGASLSRMTLLDSTTLRLMTME